MHGRTASWNTRLTKVPNNLLWVFAQAGESCLIMQNFGPGKKPWGGTDLERGYGDVPLMRKNGKFTSIFAQIFALKPPNLEIFSSQAPKFGNFPFTSPQIWKFSIHMPPLSEAMIRSQAPSSEIRAAHPYLKKSLVPPGKKLKTYPPQKDRPEWKNKVLLF